MARVREVPAAEIAKAEALTKTIATYQTLVNWSAHVEITREAWEAINDIFLYNKQITRRHAYEDVVVPPA